MVPSTEELTRRRRDWPEDDWNDMTLTGSQPEVAEFFWIHVELIGTFLNTLRISWTNLKLLEIFGIGLELFGIWLKSLGIFLFRRNIVEWIGIFVNFKNKILNYFEFCYAWRKSLNNLWKSLEHFGINSKILESFKNLSIWSKLEWNQTVQL